CVLLGHLRCATLSPYTTRFRSVQEVRGADSLSGGASGVTAPGVGKVRQFVRRGPNPLFLVSGARHFGLPAEEGIKGLGRASQTGDRKSTRLNSSHVKISYAVFR